MDNEHKEHQSLIQTSARIKSTILPAKKKDIKNQHLTAANFTSIITTPHHYAFLDTGNTNSYISQPTAAYLQLEETNHQEQLLFGCFFNSQTIEAKTVDITVQSFGNDTLAFELTYVLIKANINLNAVDPEKLNDICSQYDHLKDICSPDFSNNDVALVIGTDNIDIISPKTSIKGNQNVPRAVLTALG